MQLTEHFKLSEFTKSGTAIKYGIDNSLDPNYPKHAEIIANLRTLCVNVLEPLRQWYGKPIVISSGYRSPAVNNHPEVRGATKSQHMTGEAADLHIPTIKAPNGSSVQDMATARKWIEHLLGYGHFDQLILEHDKSGHYWIHVSFKRTGTNRQTYIPNLLKK